MFENYLAIGLLDAFSLGIVALMIHQNISIDPERKRCYFLSIMTTILITVAELFTVIAEESGSSLRILNIVSNMVGFSLAPVICIVLSLVFSYRQNIRIKKRYLIPAVINFIFILLSPTNGLIFSVSPDNVYQRGPYFWVFIVAYVFSFGYMAVSMFRTIDQYQSNAKTKLICILLFIFLGTSIQIIFPFVHTSWACVTLSIALHYGFTCEFDENFDSLTSLFNRKCYEADLKRLEKRSGSIIIIADVDHFKGINDHYGHQYGDFCLRTLAHILQDTFRKTGVCYRIGGDEFCVLCDAVSDATLQATINQMNEAILAEQKISPRLPTLSYGISRYSPENKQDVQAALQLADDNMYQCKERKKANDTFC